MKTIFLGRTTCGQFNDRRRSKLAVTWGNVLTAVEEFYKQKNVKKSEGMTKSRVDSVLAFILSIPLIICTKNVYIGFLVIFFVKYIVMWEMSSAWDTHSCPGYSRNLLCKVRCLQTTIEP